VLLELWEVFERDERPRDVPLTKRNANWRVTHCLWCGKMMEFSSKPNKDVLLSESSPTCLQCEISFGGQRLGRSQRPYSSPSLWFSTCVKMYRASGGLLSTPFKLEQGDAFFDSRHRWCQYPSATCRDAWNRWKLG
jgi:hypothetical protein